jgi:hypothetical protein
MFFLPCEGGAFASEVDEQAGDRGVVFDPYMHVPGKAKESADVGKNFACWPVTDFVDF